MKRIVGILVLIVAPALLSACCDCDKDSFVTWGPNLYHWGNNTSTTQPMPAK